jgi:hypothetical protein
MAALSIFTCTKADATAGGHTVCTYTGTITSGATPLVIGMPIIVVGFATANFNGNLVISGGNLTTTFTATIPSQNSTETHAATATVDPEGYTLGTGILGFNKVNITSQYGQDIPYGNFIPGTLPGGGQMYLEF